MKVIMRFNRFKKGLARGLGLNLLSVLFDYTKEYNVQAFIEKSALQEMKLNSIIAKFVSCINNLVLQESLDNSQLGIFVKFC